MVQHDHKEMIGRRELFSLFWKDVKYLAKTTLTIANSKARIRPPGALQELEFLAVCQRCGKCAQACPEHAIQFAGPIEGPAMGTPILEPENTPCTLCLECIKACTIGALQDVAVKGPKDKLPIGKARIVENLCLAYQNQFCRSCLNACPIDIKAIRLHDYLYPVIDTEKCLGCGRCANVCLSPGKAIRIEPLGL